ncbi:MAG TPA: hypothetical protein VE445_06590 [Nitrososphaeraceae archaeon]|jgi:hypothetical protein|nr:hypothetical protein [Nitrososphaeraceae archaeon]
MTTSTRQPQTENNKKAIFIFSIAIREISRNGFKWNWQSLDSISVKSPLGRR